MDAIKTEEAYTIEDIYALPEGERAELIDGRIYYMAPPGRTHQRVCGKLYQSIANYIDGNQGKCEVYAAPFAVFLNDDELNYVDPAREQILVYGFDSNMMEQYSFGENVPAGIYEGFSIKVQ